MKVVGVDGCPVGWFVTVIENGDVHTATFDQFTQLHDAHKDATLLLVDIPIGLPTNERRRCDEQATELLGCRGNSVFYPPSERAMQYDEYAKANAAHGDSIGNGLSQQAFHIRHKIRETTDFVAGQYDGLVRESHPELCFAALNGQPIAYSKSSERGRNFRLNLLVEHLDNADDVYRAARDRHLLKHVRRDDILDAMVLAVAGTMTPLQTVPEDPGESEPRIYYPAVDQPSVTAI